MPGQLFCVQVIEFSVFAVAEQRTALETSSDSAGLFLLFDRAALDDIWLSDNAGCFCYVFGHLKKPSSDSVHLFLLSSHLASFEATSDRVCVILSCVVSYSLRC